VAWLRPLGHGQLAFLHGCCGELQGGQDMGPGPGAGGQLGARGWPALRRAWLGPRSPSPGCPGCKEGRRSSCSADGNPLVRHPRSVRRPTPSCRVHRICPTHRQRQTTNGQHVDWRPGALRRLCPVNGRTADSKSPTQNVQFRDAHWPRADLSLPARRVEPAIAGPTAYDDDGGAQPAESKRCSPCATDASWLEPLLGGRPRDRLRFGGSWTSCAAPALGTPGTTPLSIFGLGLMAGVLESFSLFGELAGPRVDGLRG
jgi:hypothetical protein